MHYIYKLIPIIILYAYKLKYYKVRCISLPKKKMLMLWRIIFSSIHSTKKTIKNSTKKNNKKFNQAYYTAILMNDGLQMGRDVHNSHKIINEI